MTNGKTLLYQNYSVNNERLMQLTANNHLRYCTKWNYDYVLRTRAYTPFIIVEEIKEFLRMYETVITIGADCLFTNFERNMAAYARNYVTICEEGTPISHVNGEILWFRDRGDGQTNRKLDIIKKVQDRDRYNKTGWGFQGLCNENADKWTSAGWLDILPISEQIQGFDQNVNWDGKNYNLWTPNHIMMHCLAGNLDIKYQRVKNVIDAYRAAGREIA